MTVAILLVLKTSWSRGSKSLGKNMNDLTLIRNWGAEDHLAVHIVEIVGDRLGIVHVPVVCGCISVNIP
jgi:hypothetical protein